MKQLFGVALLLMCFMLGGCVKNEFEIQFDLDPANNTPYKVVYYASDKEKGWIVETVADVKKGKFTLHGATRYPTLLFIFSPSLPGVRCVAFAARGDKITLQGSGTDPMLWTAKGNDITRQLSEWRLENSKILLARDLPAINKAVAQFVRKNPESETSVALLAFYYSRRENEQGYADLRKFLSPKALKDAELVRSLVTADMPDGVLSTPLAAGKMTMIIKGGEPATLDPASVKGSLLIFRDTGTPFKYTAYYDSLKYLSKAFPDSTNRLLADLCLQPDSSMWVRSLRVDSLNAVVRGWIPASLADSTLIAMGVRRIPFFIVLDNKGRQLYRGSDISVATQTFRKIFR